MPFLALWLLPYLSSSVPWSFFASWHPSLVQLALDVHTNADVIPPCTSPNGALCLIHPWLNCPCCNTLRGDWCWWKWQCWLYPPMWQLRGVVVVFIMPAASETQHHIFLQVQKQWYHLIHANSCPLAPAFRAGLKMWHCCYFHLFDFSFWVCK